MKQIYPCALLSFALCSLFFTASAQTYTGGSYTAVRSGYNWHTTSGPNAWDPNGEPPANCSNCQITINSGVTITLNTSVFLKNTSILRIGSDGSSPAQLIIPNSNGTDFASAYNLLIDYTAGTVGAKVQLLYPNTTINATSAGTYDGILGVNDVYNKLVGNKPSVFTSSGTVLFPNDAVDGNDLSGPITLSSSGTLPVVMLGFDAILSSDNTVALTWTTAQEVNSNYFAVERSTDGGSSWKELGTVTASGFSSMPVTYTFSDASPLSGADQYRIRSVDKDGKYGYSVVKVVRVGLISKVNVFPNPAKSYVNVTLGEGATSATNATVRLISQSGQTLVEKQVSLTGLTTISIPVGAYPQGNYLVIVSGPDGTQQTTKLFISRQ